MKKNNDQLDARRQYVRDTIESKQADGENTEQIVSGLADELYLSESTIYKDLQEGPADNSCKDK